MREAVLNALLHNDYANGAAPKVEVFSDRVEITSNGGLPYGVTEHDFFKGRSSPRNPELMRIFRDLDIVEQLGSGVPRILEAYNKDVFEIEENYIRVTLPFASKDDIDKGMLIDLVRIKPAITISEISDSLDISPAQVKRIINTLKDDGKLTREGAKKSGTWVLH